MTPALDHPQMRTHSHGGEPLGQGYAFTSGGDHQRRENGSRVVCMPRHLALFLPVTLARRLASFRATFPIQIRAGGVLPPTCTARHGVELLILLRHAASHTSPPLDLARNGPRRGSHMRRVGFSLDANGRVLSDRKRSALPVNSLQHVRRQTADAAKVIQLKRLSKCSGFDDPTHSERRLAACSPNQRNQFPL